jgi:hypothetical protein
MNSLQGILPTSCFRFSIGQPFAARLRVLENSNLSVAVHAVGELIELIVKDTGCTVSPDGSTLLVRRSRGSTVIFTWLRLEDDAASRQVNVFPTQPIRKPQWEQALAYGKPGEYRI